MDDNVSALKEQGGEAGSKELVTAAKKTEPLTVAGQLPVPYKPTVSTLGQAEINIGETSDDVQRRSKGDNPAILVDGEPNSGGLLLTTPPAFSGKSPAPDFNPLLETPKEVSPAPSRSSSNSSEESLKPEEFTPENFRALKKAAKKEKRHSEVCEQKIKELQARIQFLDLAANSNHLPVSSPIQADIDSANSKVDCQPQHPVKSPLGQTLSYSIQAEQNGLNSMAVYHPTRYDSVPSLHGSMQMQKLQDQIKSLKSEVGRLQNLLVQAEEQLKFERKTQQELRSQDQLHERECTVLQKGIENRDIKIKHLTESKAWLEKKLREKEKQIEVLVNEDQFDKIYRFVKAKSNILVGGNCCIICNNIHDKCIRKMPDGQLCNRPAKEHRQTLLNHTFKAEGKEDKCNRKQDGQVCGCPEVQHQDLGHSFKATRLCQSHLYPEGVLLVVCNGNKCWIYDGVNHKSCTPTGCKRNLICDLCEPATTKLEESLKERMKDPDLHMLHFDDDEILFSVLAYRSMVFSLYHYQKPCCERYRADIKSILQYGWRCHYNFRFPANYDVKPVPPVLLYLQLPSDDIPDTLHFPAVCELDFTATDPPPPPELGKKVVAIYGCIPPYHYVLLRDHPTAEQLQHYKRQVILAINKRLSEGLKAYYDKNKEAKLWLEGQRGQLGQRWWPILTFGHLECCLKIRVQ